MLAQYVMYPERTSLITVETLLVVNKTQINPVYARGETQHVHPTTYTQSISN